MRLGERGWERLAAHIANEMGDTVADGEDMTPAGLPRNTSDDECETKSYKQLVAGIIDCAAFSNNGMGSRADEMNRFGLRWSPAENGYKRVFIATRLADNPHLAGGPYQRQLEALPEAMRKCLLMGFWNVFEGSVFAEWDPRIHVCAPFAIPVEWEIWRGGDDGFASEAAVVWGTRDAIHDRIYLIAELYRAGMTPTEMARAVLAIDRSIRIDLGGGEIIENDLELDGVMDSASFADTGMGGGRANWMNALKCNWKPSAKGQDSRIAGKAQIHERLALKPDGHPGLIVFSTCRNVIRTLPALCYSKTRPEDVDTDGEDHLYDATRYLLGRKKAVFHRMRVVGL